jgi:Amt family ammonium transporter
LIAVGVTVVWAGVAGYVIIKITQGIVGLRVNEDDESEGLDLTEHGERGYDL